VRKIHHVFVLEPRAGEIARLLMSVFVKESGTDVRHDEAEMSFLQRGAVGPMGYH
jgi:hypothetical protein